MKLYSARDKKTDKLVSDITSPRKKFWQRRDACVDAINNHKRRSWRDYDLELVVFELVEVEDNDNNSDNVNDIKHEVWYLNNRVESENYGRHYCSCCGQYAKEFGYQGEFLTEYCYYCGARMDTE